VLNLDVGFPVDRLRAPLRAVMSGAAPEAELIEAVNRRGRAVEVQVRFAPLVNGDQDPHGSIVMMEVVEQE
jgi:two-component system CheB/CheR fusion protein